MAARPQSTVDRTHCALALEISCRSSINILRSKLRSLFPRRCSFVRGSLSSSTLHDQRGVRVALELFTNRTARHARPPNRIRSRIGGLKRKKKNRIEVFSTSQAIRGDTHPPPRGFSADSSGFRTVLLIDDPLAPTDRSRVSPSSAENFFRLKILSLATRRDLVQTIVSRCVNSRVSPRASGLFSFSRGESFALGLPRMFGLLLRGLNFNFAAVRFDSLADRLENSVVKVSLESTHVDA
ncbi:hypothetical protein K0M31_018840 [Melipona bicolor]|uniref:Uncharacterized protein n=1 Tax=Melipona bicolor TaxID=60889 RepID=A0AA40G4D0_9HYME|nr:hypothetical protein K0M31_018840 [Melipona bicolor]